MIGQTHSRGISILLSFETSQPFDRLPAWKAFRRQPLADQAAGLHNPEVRARLTEAVRAGNYGRAVGVESRPPQWNNLFVYDKPLPPWRSVAEIAAVRGIDPIEAFLDEALARDLKVFFIQPITPRDPDVVIEMMRHPRTVMTFSDAGAHVSQVADASIQTHLLAYWLRGREVFTLPEAIQLITGRVAAAFGFADRGLVREGFAADLNVFDPHAISPGMPEVARDLPTGARRILQKSQGISATIVGGEVTLEHGEPTGATPGRLLRRP